MDGESSEGATAEGFAAELEAARDIAREVVESVAWCHVAPVSTQVDLSTVFLELGRVARHVRGSKMRTSDGLYDEFAAAWQFPSYFGENANAFIDCMTDLHRTAPTEHGYVVLVTHPEEVLIDLVSDLGRAHAPLVTLVDMLESCVEDLAEAVPGRQDDPTARPALSFDVVLLPDAKHRDRVAHLWRTAGAPIAE